MENIETIEAMEAMEELAGEESEIVSQIETVGEAAVAAANETVGKFTHGLIEFFKTLCTWENLFKLIGALVIIILIWLVFKFVKRGIKRIPEQKMAKHYKNMLSKSITYLFFTIVVMYILSLFGVKLSAIWGAAGIAGVAIGFAAQTSVSNFISGLFVIGEKTMKIGDFIIVGSVSGTVDEIGLLSVKVHNSDGQMIRIPNSTIINTNFQNNSFFEKRRMTFEASVAYDSDLEKALQVLSQVPSKCPTVLKEPEAKVWFDGLEESGLKVILAVWFNPSDLVQTKNDVYVNIVKLFKENNLEIPYSKLDVNITNQKQ